jgi:hypothetical protein
MATRNIQAVADSTEQAVVASRIHPTIAPLVYRRSDDKLVVVDPDTGTAYELDVATLGTLVGALTGSPIQAAEVTFTEQGAGTYTGSVNIPAGASIVDILVNGVALWDAATSATLKVGDAADDDGYYTGVNLKATDLLAGESLSFALAGGKAGAYIANSQVSPRYSATARVISGIVTTVGAGTLGRTRLTVLWSAPQTAAITAASFA